MQPLTAAVEQFMQHIVVARPRMHVLVAAVHDSRRSIRVDETHRIGVRFRRAAVGAQIVEQPLAAPVDPFEDVAVLASVHHTAASPATKPIGLPSAYDHSINRFTEDRQDATGRNLHAWNCVRS